MYIYIHPSMSENWYASVWNMCPDERHWLRGLIHKRILTMFVTKSTWSPCLNIFEGTERWSKMHTYSNPNSSIRCKWWSRCWAFLLQWILQSTSINSIHSLHLSPVSQICFQWWTVTRQQLSRCSLWEASKKPLLEALNSEDQVINPPLAPSANNLKHEE